MRLLHRSIRSPCPLMLGVAVALSAAVGGGGGCGAPRDPDLAQRAQAAIAEHQERQAEAKRTAAATEPAPAKVEALPTRNLDAKELKRIMAAINGDGARLFADLRTERGVIRCELDPKNAPQTVANFVSLSTGQTAWSASSREAKTSKPFYDGLSFHRVVSDFIIQTGNPGGRGGPGWALPREDGGSAHFTRPGALAMVDASNGRIHASQFFIATRADKRLAGQYAAFGACQNLDTVAAISKAPTEVDSTGKSTRRPKQPEKLWSVKVYRGE